MAASGGRRPRWLCRSPGRRGRSCRQPEHQLALVDRPVEWHSAEGPRAEVVALHVDWAVAGLIPRECLTLSIRRRRP